MKEVRERTTTTYEVGNGFMVDIVYLPQTYEAWIYEVNYGVKTLMFGCPKYQEVDKTIWTPEMFRDLVEENLEEYIESYTAECMD